VIRVLLIGGLTMAGMVAGAEGQVALYAGLGPELITYRVDVAGASLEKVGSVTVPENVQEAWPHPSRKFLYVAWSNNRKGAEGRHGVTAFRIDPGNGVLRQHGQPTTVAARSVFLTADGKGKHIVVAYNEPSKATVHRIADDGTLGAEVPQPGGLDFGVYAHQVRVDPSNQMVIVPTRGNGPPASQQVDPGAIKVYGFKDGVLSNRASIAPGGGHHFQPRHLEFHPSRPFAYVTLEGQNKLQAYRLEKGTLSAAPLFTKETLVNPGKMARQATSTLHAHPNGRFLYVGNRGMGKTEFKGKRVQGDWENSIAVYAINPDSGEPTLIQNADTRGVHPRTFALDPSGRMLVVANMEGALLRNGEEVRSVAATLSVLRIGADGKLEFVRKYDQERGGLFWTGMVALP
jgi:6-phosphogluconolactonase (cycloisomerase 2 family)